MVEAVSAEAGDAPLHAIESLCMRCHQNGTTRFYLLQFQKDFIVGF